MDFYFANIKLSLTSSADIIFQSFTSKNFTQPLTPTTLSFKGEMTLMPNNLLKSFERVFTGKSFDEIPLPYMWHILKQEENQAIEIIFDEHEFFNRSVALINPTNKTINIFVEPKNSVSSPITVDPMEHPLSSLLFNILAQLSGGFLVHASGVVYSGKGHLFTAVSGTGKSTMAKLWQTHGATIINDDRLWLLPIDDRWYMFNTPMVWYAENPRMAPLDAIYLLHQSPENQMQQISGVNASMRFMSNCIQHFYDQTMSGAHIDKVLLLTQKTPIYDLGFKPNQEVVEMLLNVE